MTGPFPPMPHVYVWRSAGLSAASDLHAAGHTEHTGHLFCPGADYSLRQR